MIKGGNLSMKNAMIEFTKTALFNVDTYRQGVYYTIPLTNVKAGDEPVYANIFGIIPEFIVSFAAIK